LSAFQKVHASYITLPLILAHRKWHQDNSIGGTRGRGSGTILAGMHAVMLRKFELYVDPSGRWRIPIWSAAYPIPRELFLDPRFQSLDPQHTRYTDIHNVEPAVFTTPYTGSGDSVYDFETLDDRARSDGLQLHNSVHAAMKLTMSDSGVSPTDPAFFLWHQYLQYKIELWLASPNGIQWKAQNPTHPFLTGVDDFASPTRYMNEGRCGNAPQPGSSKICQWLEQFQMLVNPTLA